MAMNNSGIFCRFCGQPNTRESTFCGICGKQLIGTEDLATHQASSPQLENSAESPATGDIKTTIKPDNNISSPDAQTHIYPSGPNLAAPASGANFAPPSASGPNLAAPASGANFAQSGSGVSFVPPPAYGTNLNSLASGPNYSAPGSGIYPGSSPSINSMPTANFTASPPSLPSMPTASFHDPATGIFQAPVKPPVHRPFWTLKKVLITFTTLLLILLIAAGSIFVYAFQLGKSSTSNSTIGLLSGSTPTSQTSITPTDTPTSVPTPDATATAAQSTTSTPDATGTATAGVTPTTATNTTPVASGTALYAANFTQDASSWTTGNWSVVDGTLINSGTGTSTDFVAAPYQPSTRDYAITVTLTVPSSNCNSFAIVARGASDGSGIQAVYQQNSGYVDIATSSNTNSTQYNYNAGTNKFTMRLEVKDISIKVYINNSTSPQVTLNDTSHTDPGLIGLSDDYCQAQVYSFKVEAL